MRPDTSQGPDFLAAVGRLARSHFGIEADDYLARVQARLDLGQRLYGDRYLSRDNLAEAAEEAEDAAVYCLLELHRAARAGEVDPDTRDHLALSAAAAALADHHAGQARRRLREGATP